MISPLHILKIAFKHPLGPILVVLQLALTIALVTTALQVIHYRFNKISTPSGVTENLFSIHVVPISADIDLNAMVEKDLDIIRRTPGVISASSSYAVPYSNTGFSAKYSKDFNVKRVNSLPVFANFMAIDEHGLETLGSNLIAGRNFLPKDIRKANTPPPSEGINVIVTKKLAEDLFGESTPIGKALYETENYPLTIVGVIETLVGWPNWGLHTGNVILIPDAEAALYRYYLARVAENADINDVMENVYARLNAASSNRIMPPPISITEQKNEIHLPDKDLIRLMISVSGIIILLSAIATLGLSSFFCDKRKAQIVIRKALGATREHILFELGLEVVFFVLIAALLGVLFHIAISHFLIAILSVAPSSPFYFLTASLIVLVAAGLATVSPTWHAACIEPSEIIQSK